MRTLLLIGLCVVAGNVARADESRMVRVSLRAVEIDAAKLAREGLRHPLRPMNAAVKQVRGTTDRELTTARFATERNVTEAFQPLHLKGCATVVARPILIAAAGQAATAAEFRDPSFGGLDQRPLENVADWTNAATDGFGVRVLPRIRKKDQIELELQLFVHWNDEFDENRNRKYYGQALYLARELRVKPHEVTAIGFLPDGDEEETSIVWLISAAFAAEH